MKILAFGGAGYIGSHVVRALIDNGHKVAVFDNMSSGRHENLFPDTQFIEGDILDFSRVRYALEGGYDAFIHLAAYKAAGESMIVPEKYSLNNISGTINLLNAAVGAGIKMMVFSSSAAVYGEPKYLPVDEAHPTEPQNYYGFTKLEIERILHWYDRLKGLRFAALRYFNAAGYDVQGRISGLEIKPENLLPVMMETASGIRPELSIFGDDWDTPDGTCVRDYVHVTDLADAHVKALEYISSEKSSLMVNLGSQNGISVKEMVEKAREITGREVPAKIAPRRPGDPAKLVASSQKAQKLLGWKAQYSDAGTLIDSTWKVYQKAAGRR